jgi:DnaJ-class molecular chaperone
MIKNKDEIDLHQQCDCGGPLRLYKLSGKIFCLDCDSFWYVCEDCEGSGRVWTGGFGDMQCRVCDGIGKYPKYKYH